MLVGAFLPTYKCMAWTQDVRLGAWHLYPLATLFFNFPRQGATLVKKKGQFQKEDSRFLPMPKGPYVTWVWTVACVVYVHLTLLKNKTAFPSTLTINITFRLHLFYLNPLSSLFFVLIFLFWVSFPKLNLSLEIYGKTTLTWLLICTKDFSVLLFRDFPV